MPQAIGYVPSHSENNKVKFRKKENKLLRGESGWIIKLIK